MLNVKRKRNSPKLIVVLIALILMGVVASYMHSPDTNYLQDVLLWIGGTVVILALWFFIAHLLEKDNK